MSVAEQADEISLGLVSIAASTHFGILRDEMVSDSVMKTFFGDLKTPAEIRLAVAVTVIARLSSTVALLADEISGKDYS